MIYYSDAAETRVTLPLSVLLSVPYIGAISVGKGAKPQQLPHGAAGTVSKFELGLLHFR